MNIVLNEQEWAENMIAAGSLGRNHYETLSRVAKYYLRKQYDVTTVRKKMEDFVLKCDPNTSLVCWDNLLDYTIKKAKKYALIDIEYINVTNKELDIINEIKGIQPRRLAFTLLCISKYFDTISPNNNHWVSTKPKDIMSMANINTSIKRQSDMYKKLKEDELIQFSKRVDNTNIRVCFQQGGDDVLKITDFRNLGYQYMRYLGGDFFECEGCGLVEKERKPLAGRKQKYCDECAVVVKKKQNKESYSRKHNLLLN